MKIQITISMFLPSAVTQADISVYATTDQPSVNGFPFSLTCVLALTEGVTGDKNMSWTGPDGSEVVSGGRVTVDGPTTVGRLTNLTLTFDPLENADAGTYMCTASADSPATTAPLSGDASWDIVVEQSEFGLLVLYVLDSVKSS